MYVCVCRTFFLKVTNQGRPVPGTKLSLWALLTTSNHKTMDHWTALLGPSWPKAQENVPGCCPPSPLPSFDSGPVTNYSCTCNCLNYSCKKYGYSS